MKIPKTRNMYCRKCKKHTEHKVSEAKRKTMGSTHTQSYGSETRARKRGKKRGFETSDVTLVKPRAPGR